ncbi:outer membrane beta-barrel protein [Roseateles sp.]|uniref:outer membrane beta-barrel protein n=1 Tax=Roseateles sp. TaxID=1971397 RepID=UPI0039EC9192
MPSIRILAAGLALGLSAAASAQVPNLAASTYIGVQIGTGKVDLNCSANTRCSPVDTSYSLRAGHRFSESWAFEVTYAKIDSDWGLFGYNYSAEFAGFGVGAAYSMPLSSSVSAVLRAGISSNELKLQPAVSPFSQNPGTLTTRSVKPYAGLGASWQFARRWSASLSADWTRADLRDTPASAKQGVTVRTLGAGMAFNF